ncbi:MAG: signal recognition particle protein [SAR202 cluster bacterium]|nr:signal recognition particle protein [SAR202 cluster bacterium]|tara:strand:+ start:71500 stop:72828 length:1329 start_codon:yes stop_codon:yes gene_type:complete
MFENLSNKITHALKVLGNKGRITEKDLDGAMREIRLALLEADVNFKVVKSLISKIRERAIGSDILESLNAHTQIVKITNDELTSILTGESHSLRKRSDNACILIVGLNGAGKTTTAAKLAKRLNDSNEKSFLVPADLARPAAVKQLISLSEKMGLEVHKSELNSSPVQVCKKALTHSNEINAAWTIIDTAGRLQVDTELMEELKNIKDEVKPDEVLLVVDAMTGQDSVNVAKSFDEYVGLTGLILSKLDGDARGGAALSITKVTGVPIKFIGTGEHPDALEPFHPDRLASRILGMGDIVTLAEKAQKSFDETKTLELEKKMRQSTFDLEDFLGQLDSLKSMGPLSDVLGMIPGMNKLSSKLEDANLNERNLSQIQAIILSMTIDERRNPHLIKGSRKKRIAKGSGTSPQQVNQLLNQFNQTRKLMKQMNSGQGFKAMQRLLR